MIEARYGAGEGSSLRCGLCPHACSPAPGKAGLCGVRVNSKGKLYTLNYGKITSSSLDPVEKKPLYHFFPGRKIFSIGTFGCNLACPFCQNWSISRGSGGIADTHSPEDISYQASRNGSVGVAYTYSEPVVWHEFISATAPLVREQGLKNVLVTNGFINDSPWRDLLKDIDAVNIDLKSFSDATYRRVLRGRLADVLRSIETALELGIHVEITTLVVTGMNDSLREIEQIGRYIEALSKTVPWHVSRYFPRHEYHEPATEILFMNEALQCASSIVPYVYGGNMAAEPGFSSTYCAVCGTELIKREGYEVRCIGMEGERCRECLAPVPIIIV